MTLSDYITRHLRVPFSYGRMDCALFAAGWVREKTGTDPIADLPKWANARQAKRLMKKIDMERWLDQKFTPINPHKANDGDLAIYQGSVCIFSGAHIVGTAENGLQFINRMEAECAWSI